MKEKIAKWIDLNTNCEKNIIKASKWYHKEKNQAIWRLLAFIKHRRNKKRYNIEIYPEYKLGNIQIPHAVGIVIGRTSEIGDNTIIMPNVVVGAKYSPKQENPSSRRHAIIGENCILGTGCKIIGNIIIGNNVTIGANSVVTKDVPSNSVVVGINKIINKEEENGRKKV